MSNSLSLYFVAFSLFLVLVRGAESFYNVNGLRVGLRNNSQTIGFLALQGDNTGFSYTPNDNTPVNRLPAAYHHLGDVTFRVRPQGSTGAYTSYSTSNGGPASVQPLTPSKNVFAAADLSPILTNSPLRVQRYYAGATDGSDAIEMWFVITNAQTASYELGSFGFSMIFNNYWTGLNLQTTAQQCSITDPYIGADHGWVKVSHMTGQSEILLVTALNKTTFEGWRMIKEDPTPRSGTFEGFYEWMVHTEAWATNEWQNNPNPWNPPTSLVLKPGDTVTYGLRLTLVTQGVTAVDAELLTLNKAVVQGVPGYVLSTDMSTAYAFVHPPSNAAVQSIVSTPPTALKISSIGSITGGWLKYQITGTQTGRSRLSITYGDGSVQTVHYFVLPPLSTHISSFGAFLAKYHWYINNADPFARSYSFMDYDASIPGIIVQESRSYVAGLSDEAGAGSGLGISMKNQFQPMASEVELIDLYINKTLWGQKLDGYKEMTSLQGPDWSIKRSMFYIGMPNYNYTVRSGWTKTDSVQVWRSYNYPHPTAVYWSMYRLARNYPNLIKYNYPAQWYLTQAANTFISMWKNAPGYAQFGLMVGSVHKSVMDDLQAEGLTSYLTQMNTIMQTRTKTWASLPFPFGSEFPWDSTGQEEIYTFTQFFADYAQSNATLSAVLAYMPSTPMWAYHGSAKRYWDFEVNGKIVIGATERALHHYGSGINAIPVLSAYRANPDNFYLLQIGIGAISGVLTNIQVNSGWTSMAFHGDPSLLSHDPYYADYGVAFYGHAQQVGSYVVNHPTFGYIGFLCDVQVSGAVINIVPRDSFHQRVYIASLGLYITLETGSLASLQLNPSQKTLSLSFTPNSSPAYQYLRVKIEVPTIPSKTVIKQVSFTSPSSPPVVRNAYQLPPATNSASLTWMSA